MRLLHCGAKLTHYPNSPKERWLTGPWYNARNSILFCEVHHEQEFSPSP